MLPGIKTPYYLIEEDLLRKNLMLIKSVKEQAGIEIIMAFKAFASWKVFPIIREYIPNSTASSTYEARLAYEELGSKAHTFTPAYTHDNIADFMKYSSHLTFNSLSQFNEFYPYTCSYGEKISCGIRINPEFSEVETDLYNPCAPGSRFGVTADLLPESLPAGIEGFHFHTLCESNSFDLEKTLIAVEERFGEWFRQIKWLNMGGGHLMTRKGYNTEHLVTLLRSFKARYPHLTVILEPGSAFLWQTGPLVTQIVDIVSNHGIRTAIINASFTCHMPDCLEMPYQPKIRESSEENNSTFSYRIGGNSCLSGDFMGDWEFKKELKPGDYITFEDMIHYTLVKTNMFNGIHHPSILLKRTDGSIETLREFGYDDYKSRMD